MSFLPFLRLLFWVIFRFIFTFVDAVGAVSAAAGALRFFACPKKVTKKMAFTFFMKKRKTKKAFKEVSLKILSNCGGFLWVWYWIFSFVFFFVILNEREGSLSLCDFGMDKSTAYIFRYRLCVNMLGNFAAVLDGGLEPKKTRTTVNFFDPVNQFISKPQRLEQFICSV
ncbi:MAG: hypothetical protein R3Y27_00615 [Clostridia bacterium]